MATVILLMLSFKNSLTICNIAIYINYFYKLMYILLGHKHLKSRYHFLIDNFKSKKYTLLFNRVKCNMLMMDVLICFT